MPFVRKPADEVLGEAALTQLRWIKAIEPVRIALEKGGWLAGGIMRQLMLGENLQAYLTESPADCGPKGDVDIFFPSTGSAKEAIDAIGTRIWSQSLGGGAKEIVADGRVRIQIVDRSDLTSPSIEALLEGFDFNNCKVGLEGDEIVYSSDFWELEEKKLLRITRANTPFLGSRVLKYLKRRGFVGITDDSAEHMTSWLCAVSRDDEVPMNAQNTSHFSPVSIRNTVMNLADKGLLRKEDLIFFIGKWTATVDHSTRYEHLTEQVDWALDQIGTYKEQETAV